MRERVSDRTANRQKRLYPLIALTGLVVLAPHLLGGAFAWGTLTLAMLGVGLLAGVLWLVRDRDASELGSEPVALLLLAVLAITALHVLPLPAFLGGLLAPESLANTRETASGLGLAPPSWVRFSLDPGQSYERAVYAIAVLAAFCATRLLANVSRRTPILQAVAISGIVISFSHLGHRMFEATHVYGMYAPAGASPRGPLMNPNNLAGFLALTFPVCLGLALNGQRLSWPWFMGGGVIVATGLLSGSRGGLAALLSGCALFSFLYWVEGRNKQRSSKKGSSRTQSQPRPRVGQRYALILIALIAVFGYTLAELAANDFVDANYQDTSKFSLFEAEVRALFSNWRTVLFGVGRGAFGSFFAGHYGPWRALHAENLVLQYAIEFGIPLALAFQLGMAWRIGTAVWRCNSAVQLGGLVGVLALTLQNLVDFGLELSGVAVPAAIALAAALPSSQIKSELGSKLFNLRNISYVSLAGSAALLLLLGRSAVKYDPLPVQAELNEAIRNRRVAAFWDLLRDVAPAHPADPAFAALAASESVIEQSDKAAFWLNRTMSLAPQWGSPHLWAAQWLASQGRRDQALIELRAASELDLKETLKDLCAWVSLDRKAQLLLDIAPKGRSARVHFLDAAAHCLREVPEEAAKLDRVLLAERPDHIEARLRSIRRNLWAKDYKTVLTQTAALRATSSQLADPYELEAQALIALGQPERAVRLLMDATMRVVNRRALLIALVHAQTSTHDAEGMRNTIDQLRLEASGDVRPLAETTALLARSEAALGNQARALKALREAYALVPESRYLVEAANLATQLGQLEFALSAWRQLCGEQPNEQEYCRARDALLEGQGRQP